LFELVSAGRLLVTISSAITGSSISRIGPLTSLLVRHSKLASRSRGQAPWNGCSKRRVGRSSQQAS